MKQTVFLSVLCLAAMSVASAQDVLPLPMDQGAVAVWQALKKLDTLASALHVTAHPDDEDGGMLVEEARGHGVRMGLLTLTRGEGGQNLMTADYFDAEGILRTRELLDADRYYGTDQMFSRVIDYGFSKTAEESRQKWGEQRALADVVRAIRTYRPLVVIPRFEGTERDGHGNHQLSGILAREAFYAAADPTKFPDQLAEGLRPWQARKLYMDNVRASEDWNVAIDTGAFDPVLGDTYVGISRLGWWNHRSQYGGGAIAKPGDYKSYYKRLFPPSGAGAHEAGFFDGLDVSLQGLSQWAGGAAPEWLHPALERISAQVAQARSVFRVDHPEAVVAPLATGLNQLRALRVQVQASAIADAPKADIEFELGLKVRQFQNAIAEALGLVIYPTVSPEREPTGFFARFVWPDTSKTVTPGESFGVTVQIASRSTAPAEVTGVYLAGEGSGWKSSRLEGVAEALTPTSASTWKFAVQAPTEPTYTRPYWRPRDSVEESWYHLELPQYALAPFAPYPLHAEVTLAVAGTTLDIGRDVWTTQHVNGQGQVLSPLLFEPALSVQLAPRAGVIPLHSKGFDLTVNLRGNVSGAAASQVHLQLPAGWRSEPREASVKLARAGDAAALVFRVIPVAVRAQPYTIMAVAKQGGQEYREGYREVGYPGLRSYPFFTPATYRAEGVEVRVAAPARVGYVMGTGDAVPQALETLGVHPTLLSPVDLATGDLSQYGEIMLGIRAYAARPDVRAYNARLLDYVRQGGVLVVQYNTTAFDHNYGPYPYKMGSAQEVSEEDAAVEILAPQEPVLNFPNRITQSDFANWVEQRGSRFLDSWDARYTPLLSSHDLNQAPQKGGFLVAHYGKGIYVLQSYALYRQLGEGVPGAFRLLANLVSLANAK